MKSAVDLIGKNVIAETGPGGEYAKGKVIELNEHPTYIIEKENGERFSWPVAFTRPDESPPLLLLDVTVGEWTVRQREGEDIPYYGRNGKQWTQMSVTGDVVLALAQEVARLRANKGEQK